MPPLQHLVYPNKLYEIIFQGLTWCCGWIDPWFPNLLHIWISIQYTLNFAHALQLHCHDMRKLEIWFDYFIIWDKKTCPYQMLARCRHHDIWFMSANYIKLSLTNSILQINRSVIPKHCTGETPPVSSFTKIDQLNLHKHYNMAK